MEEQMSVRRIFVEKRQGMNVEAIGIQNDLSSNLGIRGLKQVRLLNRYDVEGISDAEFEAAKNLVFSEPNADLIYEEAFEAPKGARAFAVEYLPGQYDQRADSAAQCIQILTQKERPAVRAARVYILEGDISEAELRQIKSYCINPVESREAEAEKPDTLTMRLVQPEQVPVLTGFCGLTDRAVSALREEMGLAMSAEDLCFCRTYFAQTERRDPTMTEIRVIDTYWSDHCRHTTFLTRLRETVFADETAEPVRRAYAEYLKARETVYGERTAQKEICLMDIATMGMKYLKKTGKINDLDESEEINACSIRVQAEMDGRQEDWLVMFKNETHNHPTEIEPFGGAATCLGGAIRDPLSGRSYVYQAMRVTGSGDPTVPVSQTIKGKLPQRKITVGAAAGYSSYGNQIGLATGQVHEIYHPGYTAKRMEIGAVIAAAPAENVVRLRPQSGDVVILLGGRTGRDGIGGATGSSKEHTVDSVMTCGSEVQKGNPPTERKLQRLFRNREVSTLIKRCNDFGAGGVCVAIGELAPALDIYLDRVPKKYEGLDGTELAISESQERMAVVVSAADAARFIRYAEEENLEAVQVADITDTGRLRMIWRDRTIVDIAREFLDTNGVRQEADVRVGRECCAEASAQKNPACCADKPLDVRWRERLADLNACSQKGLAERFDSTIGAGTVLMPFSGKYQLTPCEGMAAKLPVPAGDTVTGTIMTYGFDPYLTERNPYEGAVCAVVDAVARLTAMGGSCEKARLTLQEYFERLGQDPVKWGKPFSALLGAFHAQISLGIPAIGGKDSMSGSFESIHVPPTLVAFAVAPADVRQIISPEWKAGGHPLVLCRVPHKYTEGREEIDFTLLKERYAKIHRLICEKKILSAKAVKAGGLCEAMSTMAFGNMVGAVLDAETAACCGIDLFEKMYGSILMECDPAVLETDVFGEGFVFLGRTTDVPELRIGNTVIALAALLPAWRGTLNAIFPEFGRNPEADVPDIRFAEKGRKTMRAVKIARPRVFIPVFPGTNCEYDTIRAFEGAGAKALPFIFKNLTAVHIEASVAQMRQMIDQAQIVMIPGGFSGGDEPDGSGKFIATAFRNPVIRDAVMRLLKERDGLMLGICNGFQALIKLGLVPYGEIRDLKASDPTLTFNTIGRHISRMVYTKVASVKSPWLWGCEAGEVHTVPISHGEGRFVAEGELLKKLAENGQIATQYADEKGTPTMDPEYNPNGSVWSIEGITSPDGRVLGKMAHSERIGSYVCENVPGNKDQKIFASGVNYFS